MGLGMTYLAVAVLLAVAASLSLRVLAANRQVDTLVDQRFRTIPVAGNVRIFKGAFVGLNAGLARPLVAGDAFAGVAYAEANNLGGAAGAINVQVDTVGDIDHFLDAAAVANNGALLYASDDETLTTVAGGNSLAGRQVSLNGANRVMMRLKTVYDRHS